MRSPLCSLVMVVVAHVATFASLASSAEPLVPDDVRLLMQEREYAKAVQAIEAAVILKDAPVDYLGYLKARALHLDGKFDDAIVAYSAVEREFPKSPWARQAKFGRAVSLVRHGDFRAAEGIYREEAAYLLSTVRKQEIADIYLEFAGGYFKPADENVAPDFAKALEFYGKALEAGPLPEKRIEVELLMARCQQSLGKPPEAAQLFARFVKDHPGHGLNVEARFRLGEVQLAQGQEVEARRTWQDLLAAQSDSKSPRVPEAAFNLAVTFGMPAPGSPEDLSLGVAALESFVAKYPDHKLASKAHLHIAQAYAHRGRYEDAVAGLKKFLADERYAAREEVADARNLLGRAYQLQKKFPEALAAWRDYLAKHPAHEAWSGVQQRIIDTEFLMGLEERQAKRYDAAVKLWTEFLAKYPLENRSRTILYQFGAMNFEQEKWAEALADWRRLVSKYPGTNEASQAQFMIAATLEEKQTKFDEALKEFRKLNWGTFAAEAQRRINRLTAKSMSIATERVFRSDETPKIKLVTRNVESVQVRAYTVDLETYFRKMHLARGLEGLDIALIDPDKTFEFKVPKYAEHQQLESEIELPLPKVVAGGPQAGVLAVTVSSKTLEATTMIVQSDLDVIVKSSRDEVFVFAENMLTGKPWPKARLLISNGSQVFAEGTTGDDGVFQHDYKELKDAADVRVFAIAESSVASNVVSLNGVGVAAGLEDKGYIYTDRPAYRAGQVVHVRGVLRRAAGDAYVIDKGKKYAVEVFDARNRLVWQDKAALGDFGSFHQHFLLPATSPAGDYRIQVRDGDNKSFQGVFTVHEYQLEPVRLIVDTDRKVYYRGEEIVGKIRAEFYYGAPLAGREIRYQLADGRSYTATADDKGEVAFKLPTRDFRESQALPLVVSLPERNLQTAANFFLATQGYTIGVKTVRPVYVAGETFEASVTTTDAEGKPLAQKLTLQVLEQTAVDGKVGEREVEKRDLATDDKGAGRVTLKLEQGARYVLRVAGTDRFNNPVTGEHAVQISDDDDAVRLRILADKHTYKAGDQAVVRLHWREAPALALVAFQGARVLDYRLVQLQTGSNDLPIPMTANLAPNFELSIAVMTDVRGPQVAGPAKPGESKRKPLRFHQAASPFTVERDLVVKIEPKRKADAKGSYKPGEEIDLQVTTTDPQGKPISAEVSLAMVEQSLLEMFQSRAGAMPDFFAGGRREPAVRGTSSITFNYQPTTEPINSRLLAEEDRLEVEREEAARLAAMPAPASTPTAGRVALGVELRTTDEPADDFVVLTPEIKSADEWERVGGPGSIAPFSENLSLIISQTQTVDDQQAGKSTMLAFSTIDGKSEEQNLERFSRSELAANGSLGDVKAVAADGRTPQGREMPRRKLAAGKKPGGQDGQADFDSLNELITSIVKPAAWDDLSGVDGTKRERLGNDMNRGFIAPNVENLSKLSKSDQNDFGVLYGDGTQKQLALNWYKGTAANAQAAALATVLTEQGALLLAGGGSQETGYWNPAVVTDKEGKATVNFTLPDRSTGWKFVTKGITADTLAGEATSDLTAKKDLFGELKLPLAFTDGDEAEVVVSVHNDLLEKGKIEVTLKTTIGGKSVEEKKTLDVTAKGLRELTFKTSQKRPAEAGSGPDVQSVFELTVTAGDAKDVLTRSVPVQPYGVPVYATASGSASSDTTAWVEPPANMTLASPSLEILIGPTVERSLLDVLLGAATPCQMYSCSLASGLDTAVSDLMAAVGLQKLLAATRDAGTPQAQSLDARIRSSLSLLVSSQQDDGGWSWTGRGGASNRHSSAQIVWALGLAKAAGYAVPNDSFDKGVAFLNTQLIATGESDYETKAVMLHALSASGRGDFALANRLHRSRQALSNAALAYLALAFLEMDRQPMAAEILQLLGSRNLDDVASRRTAQLGSLPWNNSATMVRALYALAVQKSSPASPKAKETADWLLAHRSGHRWAPERATGTAALALCNWFSRTRFTGEKYELAVFVNDTLIQKLELGAEAVTQTVAVPDKFLAKQGKQRINFQVTGRGRFTYQAVYGGFVAAEGLKNTTNDWQVRRYHEPAPREVEGKEIPRGFGLLQGSVTTFRNPLTQLPVGQRGHVELNVYRSNVNGSIPEEQLEYLVVTEPIPAGATVIEKSVAGGFERFEIVPGAIVFYVGSRMHVETIRFDLHGYLPGQYRAAPTVVRNAYRADQMAVAPAKALTILAAGAKSGDEYRLTPQELYELGKHYFAQGDLRLAGTHLSELLAKWNLQPEPYKETAKMLLDVHLEIGPPAEVVRYFEIVKEKWPELEVSFDKIVKVGAAYHELGEYERSYLVFRATVEGSFQGESGVAGFLESQGEFARSVDVMERLLREYPPEPYLAAATYALAQRVYAKAPEAATDAKLREMKINRIDLVRQALAMLEGFLTRYPDDPAADQGSFSVANALLELKSFRQAISQCERYAVRYPKSEFLDSYWYVIGYCHFALGEHEQALAMCQKVAEHKRTEKNTGREVESLNKWQAVYILGQVYHSLGKAAQAIAEYARVADRFADAKQAIEFFTRKSISLPEVTTVKPGEAAEAELGFRNVARADAKVYRIDLMKFSLLNRNLQGITQINLSGIRPYHEMNVELGDGKDYRDRKHKLSLPLKEEGAYLVVARGDDLYASGLVLVSPLTVEIQEEAPSGRVRATVKDASQAKYLTDVHVKVIGTRNADFTSGDTDLRGVFVADAIAGTSTVIAQAAGNRYAFFRGTLDLGPPPQQAGAAANQPAAPASASKAEGKGDLLENLNFSNGLIQRLQCDNLQQLYEQKPAGVEAKAAF